jgi:hypothetical protein
MAIMAFGGNFMVVLVVERPTCDWMVSDWMVSD